MALKKKVFPMSCFGATISSFFNGSEEKYEEEKRRTESIEKKLNIFSCLSLAIREKKTNFYLRCTAPLGSTFIATSSLGGSFRPSLVSPVVL